VNNEERCSERVCGSGSWGAFHMHQCSKKATIERNGKKFCTIHDPEREKAIRAKKQAEYDAASKARQAEWEWERAAKTLCSGVDTQTMNRLGSGWLAKTLGERGK
jgi:hypothetical protein